jgi:hypothetical protein
VQSIVKNELQFRKISAQWVPRLLSDQQKMPDPHSAALTQEKLALLYWIALEHPPYSPDLSPCDYHMFGPLKEALRVQRFNDDEQVQNFMRNWLQTRPPSFYNAGITKTPNPLAKMHRERRKLCRKVRFFNFVKLCFNKKLKAEVSLYLICPRNMQCWSKKLWKRSHN